MINFYDPKRSISKLQLALCAGVCPRVFAYYLESRREILEAMGVSVIAKIFRKKSSAKRPVSCK